MYVKDLEMKSRYYEAECRRLGMLLQFYVAENHALRLSFLHNNTQVLDASTTKQESAVLFLGEDTIYYSFLFLLPHSLFTHCSLDLFFSLQFIHHMLADIFETCPKENNLFSLAF